MSIFMKLSNQKGSCYINNIEKSELLTVYNDRLIPIGDYTRAEVHANELLHQTIRLWIVHNDTIWFQKRSKNKSLFPGHLDAAVTGHISANETPETAVLRETQEEIGLNLSITDLKKLEIIPFPFVRPDGKLDNEVANIFLYRPKDKPNFQTSEEVDSMVAKSIQEYDNTINNKYSEIQLCNFCCLNEKEWLLIKEAL